MSLQIIGAAFARTGTDSLAQALEQLGVGPCYTMYNVLTSEEQIGYWVDVAAGLPPDWPNIFAGCQASLDWPVATFWRELMEVYPEATVLLTKRDPEAWYESYSKTILPIIWETLAMAPEERSQFRSMVLDIEGDRIFGGRLHEPEHMIQCYRDYMAEVEASVPKERLLTYELGSGWQPLCDWLGVPLPDIPYPKTNAPAEFQQKYHDDKHPLTASKSIR